MPSLVRPVGVLCRAVCRAVRRPATLDAAPGSAAPVHALQHTALHRQSHRSLSTAQSSPPHFLTGPVSLASTVPPSSTSSPTSPDRPPVAAAATADQSSADSQSASPSQPSFWVPFLTVLSVFPILFAVNDAIVSVATVHGRSMQPTLNPHLPPSAVSPASSSSPSSSSDVVLIWKLSAQSVSSYPAGSLLVLKSPYSPHRRIVKRLVGREKEWIVTERRRDDGERDGESEGVGVRQYGHIEQVGSGRVWVEGENEAASGEDSREYGPMPAALVQGRVLAVVWPPSRMRWMEDTLQHVGGEQRIRNRIIAW